MTRVRRATADDAEAVSALEDAIFGPDAWSPTSVLEELTGPLSQAFVAVDGSLRGTPAPIGQICGYVVVRAAGDVLDLQRIAVADDCRRSGVAGALLDACDPTGHERMLLEVRADNTAALAFYRRCGFGEIARRPAYYGDGTDAVVLQRMLTRRSRADRHNGRRG